MKRPLALAGFVYLITQLLAAFLPLAALGLLAVFFILSLLIFLWRKPVGWMHGCVIAASVAVALLLHIGYLVVFVSPLRTYTNAPHRLTVTVQNIRPAYNDGHVYAEARVTAVDGEKVRPFLIATSPIAQCETGDILRLQAKMGFVEASTYQYSYFAKGIFIGAEIETNTIEKIGKATGVLFAFRYAQSQIGAEMRQMLPRDTGAIAAAITIGDKSALTSAVKADFRMAGLSHLLVVSGLHLGMITGAFFLALSRITSQKAAAFGTCAAIICFMLFTGLTPSVIRSGIAMLVTYSGMMLDRESDAITSLGFAALLLCLQNPFAAVDIGLLLSFCATLAVLGVNAFAKYYRKTHPHPTAMQRVQHQCLITLGIPCATTLATLPVLIAIGGGVSLLTVFTNCIAVFLLPFILLCGFLLAACAQIAPLYFVAQCAGLLCGIGTKFLHELAAWAAGIPWAFVHVTGIVPLCVIAGMLALIWLGYYSGFAWRKNILCAGLFLILSVSIYAVLDAKVVRVMCVQQNIVVTQGLKTMVVFRGKDESAEKVLDAIESYNRNQVDFLLDLRRTGDTEKVAAMLCAEKTLNAKTDFAVRTTINPFHDIIVVVRKQEKGNFVCFDISDYTFCAVNGTVDLQAVQGIDALFAGGKTQNAPQVITLDTPYAGAVLRRGKSIQFTR